MASIYKKGNVWYLSVTSGKNRITRSLKTDDYKVAEALKPHIESQIIAERFLKAEHGWAQSTYDLKKHIYSRHAAGYPLPTNPNTRGIHISHINACWNWALRTT